MSSIFRQFDEIFALPRERKSFATPREQKYCWNFSSIWRKISSNWWNLVKLQNNFWIFMWNDKVSYLVNSIAILLRDRRLGGIWFLQTLVSHFIPQELHSLGMKCLPRVCKNHSLPLGDHAILYFPSKSWSHFIAQC